MLYHFLGERCTNCQTFHLPGRLLVIICKKKKKKVYTVNRRHESQWWSGSTHSFFKGLVIRWSGQISQQSKRCGFSNNKMEFRRRRRQVIKFRLINVSNEMLEFTSIYWNWNPVVDLDVEHVSAWPSTFTILNQPQLLFMAFSFFCGRVSDDIHMNHTPCRWREVCRAVWFIFEFQVTELKNGQIPFLYYQSMILYSSVKKKKKKKSSYRFVLLSLRRYCLKERLSAAHMNVNELLDGRSSYRTSSAPGLTSPRHAGNLSTPPSVWNPQSSGWCVTVKVVSILLWEHSYDGL